MVVWNVYKSEKRENLTFHLLFLPSFSCYPNVYKSLRVVKNIGKLCFKPSMAESKTVCCKHTHKSTNKSFTLIGKINQKENNFLKELEKSQHPC